MGIWTPKQHVTGCIQVIYLISREPFSTGVFQGNAKSAVKQALAWRSEGKDVWIELATPLESATKPDVDYFSRKVDPVALGREDATRGRPKEHNPYLSDTMSALWLKGWHERKAPTDIRQAKDCPRCYGRALKCEDAGPLFSVRARYAMRCSDCRLLGPSRQTADASLVAWNRDSNFKSLKRKRSLAPLNFFRMLV